MDIYLPKTINQAALVVVAVAVAAAVGLTALLHPTLNVDANEAVYQALTNQLIFLAVFAVFIERTVETYLIATGVHDDRVIDELTNTEYRYRPIGPIALTAGVVLSAAVALAGVRLLDPAIGHESASCLARVTSTPPIASETEAAQACGRFLLGSVDIILTIGLLAGGSTLLHSVIELIPTLTGRLNNAIKGIPAPTRGAKRKVLLESLKSVENMRVEIAARSLLATRTPQHNIRIVRGAGSSGTLHFSNATTSLQFPVVWDPKNRISPAVLPGCSRTIMATKKRPAIHLPGATLHGQPNNNIFIHRGRNETWSDGCFVLDDSDMASLLAAIPEENAFNITVEVT